MTPNSRAPATSTLLAKSKKAAKALARTSELTHAQALERVALDAGYSSWRELQRACPSPVPSTTASSTLDPEEGLPIDPRLPPGFDDTPNDERSAAELDQWWDRPFARTRSDGRLDVRCLDGSAWDRSTWYGVADDLDAARKLARQRLADWRKARSAPVTLLDGGQIKLVRMPQRPDDDIEVLYIAVDQADAVRWLKANAP